MKKQFYILIILFGIILIPQASFAQVDFNKPPDDDLGNVEDEYQEFFFEALKQKGIENYQRAIDALQKCLNLDSKKPIIYFELGKNYKLLENYESAEANLLKAESMQPDNEWILDELYDVYAKEGDLENAIKTVKQLVDFHPDYKQDLASLYIRNGNYQEALLLLDELDKELGTNEVRDTMRNNIYDLTGNSKDRIENLEQRVANNPNNEQNYLRLIYRYSQSGNSKKAYDAAQKWLSQTPDSKLVHLALYKFYLDDGETERAINSMKIVLNTPEIDGAAKTKVLKDFVNFVSKNPQYEKELIEVTAQAGANTTAEEAINLGQYYLKSGDKVKALQSFEDALNKEPDNFTAIKTILLLRLDLNQFDEVVTQSNSVLELYPAQPILYLLNGVANNKLNKPKAAIDNLQMGLDYLIDDPKMETDFYLQLSEAHKLDNNISQSQAFAKKAQALKAQN